MNKRNVIILCIAVFIAGEILGFAVGLAVCYRKSAVKSRYDASIEASEAAREISRNSAIEAESFRIFVQHRIENLDRLAVLNSHEYLYDTEKEESRKIVEKLAADFPEIRKDYSSETGRVKNLSEWERKIKEYYRTSALIIQKKAVDDARIAAEKQLDVLKHSAERPKRSAR